VEAGLAEQGISEGWLLGESFSSQVVWPLVARGRFRAHGIILAGGFVQHPIRWAVRLAERVAGGISLKLLTRVLFGYAKVVRHRYRHSPETMQSIDEFIARRTELDRQAAVHRLRLIANSDFRAVARSTRLPLFAISGFIDPVVPWISVRHWLRRHCPALRDYKIVRRADHTVLSSGADTAADQIVRWIGSFRAG
jgi:pimeloyl-ACP methyl ester carboxylesterase